MVAVQLCHQILFVIRCGVRLIMLLQAFYLRLVEPVLEALLIQGVGLGIDAVVVEGSGQGRLILHYIFQNYF
jgi:hypothetical protein